MAGTSPAMTQKSGADSILAERRGVLALAQDAALPLEPRQPTMSRCRSATLCDEGEVMPTRCDIRAITREAQGLSGGALILGGLLLLIVP